MQIIRVTLNVLIVFSTTFLIGFLAFDKLSNTNNKYYIDVILSALHIVYVIGSILNIIYYFRIKKFTSLVLLLLPLLLFLAAYIGVLLNLKFGNIYLIIFDFYIIYLFFYLTLIELVDKKRSPK